MGRVCGQSELQGILPVSEMRNPSVQKVYGALRQRITGKTYREGMWLPTERELAAEFSVDRSVVRAAITSLVEQGLVVRQQGRRPWVNDQIPVIRPPSLRRQGVYTLAAILPQTTNNPCVYALLCGIQRALQSHTEAAHRLMVFTNHVKDPKRDNNLEQNALEAILEDNISGLILWHISGAQTMPSLHKLIEQKIPMVLVDRNEADIPCDFVGIHNRYSTAQAVRTLLGMGHKRIAFLHDIEMVSTVHEREAGYRDALQEAGIVPDPSLILLAGLNPAEAVHKLVSLPQPPTALCCVNDFLAHSILLAMEEQGLHAPSDFSVIGFDDVDRFTPGPAALTTVQQPFEQMGATAVELLLQRLNSRSPESHPLKHVLLPTMLQMRASIAPLIKEQQ